MDTEQDGLPDEYEILEAAEDAVRAIPEAPIVKRGLSFLGIAVVAVIGVPLLLVFTAVWALLAGPLIDVVLPPGGQGAPDGGVATVAVFALSIGPPLVALFLVLRWGLNHLPPRLRRYFTT